MKPINSSARGGKIRLCRVVTVPYTFRILLVEQLAEIVSRGIALTIVSSPGVELQQIARELNIPFEPILMKRKPSPVADILALARLVRYYRRSNFDIVHSATPKAGFLSMLSGASAGIPVRMHTFTGQPWVELTGLRRELPRRCDWVTARSATACYADSFSQRDFLVKEGLVRPKMVQVLGYGSIGGVNISRFSNRMWGGAHASRTRSQLGIGPLAKVICFVGRVTRDKGVVELVTAFERLSRMRNDLELLLVGPYEEEYDPLPAEIMRRIDENPRIRCTGYTNCPEKFLGASDIFCLPSYREGFGSVAIEAAAMGLPAVVSRVTGLVDAVAENETGLFVAPKNVEGLERALALLVDSEELRHRLGAAGCLRAIANFDSKVVNATVVDEYHRLVHSEQYSNI